MRDVFAQNNALKSVDDRAQRIAFWVSLIGLVVNTILFFLYIWNDDLSILLIANYAYYSIVIVGIALSSYFNIRFKRTVALGISAIYLHMWGTAFYDAMSGNGSALSFPTLLFVPLCLVLVSGYRFLIGNAVLQGLAVFLYAKFFLASVYNLDSATVDATNIAVLLAILSSLSLGVLAVVSYARQKTDNRLLRLMRETERLAAEDPLTGLMNRRAFMNQLEDHWQKQTGFAVVFIDLDRFKPLNDEYGHAIGDTVLQVIGERLKALENVRVAARFGGDEFAILIEEQIELQMLETILAEVHRTIVSEIDIDIARVSVGASLGYALAFEDAASLSELLHAADTAMMRCKGSDLKIAKFDRAIDCATLGSEAMEELFRTALLAGNIKGALQPIVSGQTREIVGYELLARWENSGLPRDPSPMEFIVLAEKLGLLNDLLIRTLEQTLPVCQRGPEFLAINVSPSQLSSAHFVTDLMDCLTRFDFPYERLEIEVTEHVAFRNLEDNVRTLSELQALGCAIVLDDFGAGYSSLSLLDKLPLDKVKLDKSLQQGTNGNDVLNATIRLIRDLGLKCCVEGIETEIAADYVGEKGCDYMQGYYFGRPEIIQPREEVRLVS
ncbi:MAG: EAL domain-containing protein [Pseudomonadota bacterium]